MRNEIDTEKYKKILLEQKSKIENEIKELASEFKEVPEDEEEEADEAEDFFNYESIKEEQGERLSKIDKALWKIEKGIFGVCERCGIKIEEEVLEAAPESELCKECKKTLKG